MTIAPKKELSLFDSTCIIVGIIIGAGIYQMVPDVAKGASCWWGVLLIWAVGGILSLFGAICYAELATAYPKEGGDFVYLSRAYGNWSGFLFGWAQLTVVRPGDIAIMALIFARYAREIFDPLSNFPWLSTRIFAGAATIILTAINIAGVKEGKWTQNLLTVVKALGLIAIVGIAFFTPRQPAMAEEMSTIPVSLALIFVLFTYGGWNEMAYVAAEVKNPNKNIIRALVSGTLAVMFLYLIVNAAFLYTLGYTGLANSKAVASESVSIVFPDIGGRIIAALVCISALGAVNGLIFTGARISYAMGSKYNALKFMGKWNTKTRTPVQALLVQGVIAFALIMILGSVVETVLYTAVAVYMFYFGTSLSVIVLRFKEPNIERPYRVTGYPFTPIIFSCVCLLLIYSTITYAIATKRTFLIVLFIILFAGVVIYNLIKRNRTPEENINQENLP